MAYVSYICFSLYFTSFYENDFMILHLIPLIRTKIYGIDVTAPAEREFILNIMLLASADEKDRQGIFWKLDQQAKYPLYFRTHVMIILIVITNNVQAAILSIQIQEHIIDEVMRKMVIIKLIISFK